MSNDTVLKEAATRATKGECAWHRIGISSSQLHPTAAAALVQIVPAVLLLLWQKVTGTGVSGFWRWEHSRITYSVIYLCVVIIIAVAAACDTISFSGSVVGCRGQCVMLCACQIYTESVLCCCMIHGVQARLQPCSLQSRSCRALQKWAVMAFASNGTMLCCIHNSQDDQTSQ